MPCHWLNNIWKISSTPGYIRRISGNPARVKRAATWWCAWWTTSEMTPATRWPDRNLRRQPMFKGCLWYHWKSSLPGTHCGGKWFQPIQCWIYLIGNSNLWLRQSGRTLGKTRISLVPNTLFFPDYQLYLKLVFLSHTNGTSNELPFLTEGCGNPFLCHTR